MKPWTFDHEDFDLAAPMVEDEPTRYAIGWPPLIRLIKGMQISFSGQGSVPNKPAGRAANNRKKSQVSARIGFPH